MFWKDDKTSGVLSREQFEERVGEPSTRVYLKSINVDTAEADMLFSLIDEDDSGMLCG